MGEPLHVLIDEMYRDVAAYISVGAPYSSENMATTEIATVFFISMPAEGRLSYLYAVTAAHVLEGHSIVYLTVNDGEGGRIDVPTVPDDWVVHESTDVAVCRFDQVAKIFAFPISSCLDHEQEKRLFAGQEVFMIGLLSRLPGWEDNQPITRFGHLALPRTFAGIPLRGADVKVDAHLIESRSWGGESGSPVFLNEEFFFGPPTAPIEELVRFPASRRPTGSQRPPFLGLLQGHFTVDVDVRNDPEIDPLGIEKQKVGVNNGIAVVIPARKIVEVLMSEELVKDRESVSSSVSQSDCSSEEARPLRK